jgi:hypothetical protein
MCHPMGIHTATHQLTVKSTLGGPCRRQTRDVRATPRLPSPY